MAKPITQIIFLEVKINLKQLATTKINTTTIKIAEFISLLPDTPCDLHER